MDRVMLKAKAKELIKDNIGILFIISLIVYGIEIIASLVLSLIPGIGGIIYSVLIVPAFTLSMAQIYLNVTAGIAPVAGDSFNGFYDFWSAFKVQFLQGFFVFLWSLLLIVPGIIKWYSYSQAMYILAENKGMPALEAIRRSKQMMEGRKMDLFVLELSFIGWALLTAITFCIAGIWTIPYMTTTYVNFYNSIKPVPVAEAEEVVEEQPVEAIPEEVSADVQEDVTAEEIINEEIQKNEEE
ncbi:MAG: DUF975 family protein [Clostridia bacterium]|nr:DUF975 family protein [Clostridia bacterium]